MKIREGTNWNWAYWAKAGQENYEIVIDFRWSDVKEKSRKILFKLTSLRAYKSKLMRIFF